MTKRQLHTLQAMLALSKAIRSFFHERGFTMGLNIAGVSVASNGKITVNSKPGLYKSRKDGSIAIKGDSNGSKKRGVSNPATSVTVITAGGAKTFNRDVTKLKDDYDFVADLNRVSLSV
jgi:hypothetical protein